MWADRRAAGGAASSEIEPGAGPRGFDDYEVSLGDAMRGERATLGKSLLDVQRELRIKAAYVAAIENGDADVFETPGFIAGYVRSYARYLGLDPDRAFAAFCAESGFRPAHGIDPPATAGRRPSPQQPVTLARERDIFADGGMPHMGASVAPLRRVEPGAVMSVAVLLAVVAVVAWGGMSFVGAFQSVTLAPVDDAPGALASVDPLAPPPSAPLDAPEVARPEPDASGRLYRPPALDVPVLVARDGPIGAIDPASPDPLEPASPPEPPRFLAEAPQAETPEGAPVEDSAIDGAVMAALADQGGEAEEDVAGAASPQVTDPAEAGEVVLVASRPSWVRVSAADGTVLLEKIMEVGETFAVPRTEEPATLRTGNAGAVYFQLGGATYGPAGEGAAVVSGVPLDPAAVDERFAAADLSADPELERIVRVAEAAGAEGSEGPAAE